MERGCGAVTVLTIRTVAETGSTNADLLALAASGIAEGMWLRADRQTGGRGRQGRTWESPLGNLHASTLVRLHPTDPSAATLAFVAAIACHEVIAAYLGPERATLSIKWPNDLLIDRAKVAGILLERVGDAVVVGIGINLAHHPDLPDRPATSLATQGITAAPDEVVVTLAAAFARALGRWRGEGLAAIRQAWLDRAHPRGTALVARLPDGSAVEGLFDGLGADGALILRLASGEQRVMHAADVMAL